MKKFIYFLIFAVSLSWVSYSTTWNVAAQDFVFNPASLPDVHVNDTIKWQWLGPSSHTTTSVTIPSGALPWDSPLNNTVQTFRYVVTVPGSYQYKCTPHFPMMVGSFTANFIGIISEEGVIPSSYNLYQNYPNPFNPSTYISFDIPEKSFVTLTVHNILGKEIDILVNQNLETGSYKVDWNASKYSSGIYLYRLETSRYSQTRKMTVIK